MRRGLGMRMAIRFFGGLLMTLAFATVACPSAGAASFDFNDSTWEGGSELLKLARDRLGQRRIHLVAALDLEQLKPRDGLLMIHPTVTIPTDALNEFMLAGGRLAVLDDFGSSAPFLERFGIRRINPPLRPDHSLRGNPNLAWAVPAGATGGDAPHGLVVGLQRLLTNHPTTFVNPGLTSVLEIHSTDGGVYPLAISGVIGQRGRLLVVGDPSAVINQMLRYPENRLFAEHLIDYLVEDDTWGTRNGDVYLVVNEFSVHGNSGDALSARMLSSRLQDAGRALVHLRIPEFGVWIFGIAVSLILGREAWQRMARRTEPYRPRFAMPAPLASQPGEAGRAAVLAAPTTPRSLVLLELMAAISAYLASRMNNEEQLPMSAVFDAALERQLLNQTQRAELTVLLALVNRVQVALVNGGQSRVRLKELRHAHALMLDITKTIEHRQPS